MIGRYTGNTRPTKCTFITLLNSQPQKHSTTSRQRVDFRNVLLLATHYNLSTCHAIDWTENWHWEVNNEFNFFFFFFYHIISHYRSNFIMTQAIISLHSGKTPLCLPVNANAAATTTLELKQQIYEITSIPINEQVLRTRSGHTLVDQDLMTYDEFLNIQLSGRMLGGKGGFGSMLRAQGGRMNAQKTTNFEACRDLQGRRIRTVNDAKK